MLNFGCTASILFDLGPLRMWAVRHSVSYFKCTAGSFFGMPKKDKMFYHLVSNLIGVQFHENLLKVKEV